MLEIINLILENEMDLPLTHKRAVTITKLLGLTVSTQTTFATAVSEASRAVIERTLNNVLSFFFLKDDGRWFLVGRITTDSALTENSEELKYAKRLVPVLEVKQDKKLYYIDLKLGMPKSILINKDKVSKLKKHMQELIPESPYEEIKQKVKELSSIAEEKDEQLRLASFLNEKKSEFLSIASHELKTPLTVIKVYAQVARSLKDKDINKMVEYLDKIDQQATKVNNLVQQLLDLTKIENDKVNYRMEEVDLAAFLKEVLDSISYSHPNHPIVLKPFKDISLSLDKLRIEQVIVNLVSNAAKYSPNGKAITVEVDASSNQALTIGVTDQGIGLSEENLTKVFDKFFRAEDVIQKISGLGMGLYITTRIIKEHKGKIWAVSQEGKGSTFYFSLPRLQIV